MSRFLLAAAVSLSTAGLLAEDTVEFLTGSTVTGRVVEIRKDQREFDLEMKIGQYVWEVINPNRSKWREGIKFLHHVVAVNENNRAAQKKALNQLGKPWRRQRGDSVVNVERSVIASRVAYPSIGSCDNDKSCRQT
jgi:hypothetical protein